MAEDNDNLLVLIGVLLVVGATIWALSASWANVLPGWSKVLIVGGEIYFFGKALS